MADSTRIVFPDEVEDIKAAAAEAKSVNKGGDTNSIEAEGQATAETVVEPGQVQFRNMIVVPPNCPPGHEMDANGVCREVFN